MASTLGPVLSMRLLVGFLGEKAQFGWWPTAFYEASARPFLEPIFAKRSGVAQYHGVVEAACRVHDKDLNVGTYHLFRLPEEMEQDLHALALTGSDGCSPLIALGDTDSALNALGQLVGLARKSGTGPVHVGSVSDLIDRLNDIASIYHFAFQSDSRSFPYLAH